MDDSDHERANKTEPIKIDRTVHVTYSETPATCQTPFVSVFEVRAAEARYRIVGRAPDGLIVEEIGTREGTENDR